ncbi:MAG TPA: shikimate dehydrogenase [Usitatibacter sp.]|nr:shikimate dehydrogenase [Usitatibacter sp.]
MDRYVVIGNPVSHSLSPEIHAAFAKATGETLEYDRLLVPAGKFMQSAQRFFDEGGRGANVTLPFKVDAFNWAGARTQRATVAEAANFLIARDGFVEADNTDGAGLVADLTRNHGVRLGGAKILVLGAGGAVRGILAPLLAQEPDRIVVANRTAARAMELAARFRNRGPIEGVALDAIARDRYDLVLNATSTSTHGEALALPAQVLASPAFAYDLAYGPGARAFVERAKAAGMKASDGLGMLVEQAAESFELWRGVRPDTAPVLSELRARMA